MLFRLFIHGDDLDFSYFRSVAFSSIVISDCTSFVLENEQHPLECDDFFRRNEVSFLILSDESSCTKECSVALHCSLSDIDEVMSFSVSSSSSLGGKTFSWKIPGMLPYGI